MATKSEMAIREALVKSGYFPRAVLWIGGVKGWLIRYAFLDQQGAFVAEMYADSVTDARRKIGELGANRTA